MGSDHHRGVPRILLLLPTATYRASDFVAAAARLGVDVVVGSEHRQALSGSMGDRAVVVPLANVDAAVSAIVALHRRSPLDAVLAVDDQGVVIASAAATCLGFRHNPPDAVAATRDKTIMRERLGAASLPQPAYRIVAPGPTSPRPRRRSGIRAWSSLCRGRPAKESSVSMTRSRPRRQPSAFAP